MRGIRLLGFITLLMACPLAGAQNDPVPEPPPIPPDSERALPPRGDSAGREDPAAPAGERVIERVEGDRTITEYRRHGQVYMYKVKPKNGPAQYWIDREGDGQFQPHETDISDDVNLPKWRIGNW